MIYTYQINKKMYNTKRGGKIEKNLIGRRW